jgi:hypothetical protein
MYTVITLGFLAFLSKAQAVSPAPDGCYPGFTTAEGCNALKFLTTGAGNTGLGWYSLYVNTTGSYNTGVGAGTLVLNAGDSNTAVGAAALLLNTNGGQNTAVGTDALVYNDSGSSNSALGAFALFNNHTGSINTAIGLQALQTATGVDRNTAVGAYTLQDDTIGDRNTAVGTFALSVNTEGAFNTAVGVQALDTNLTGSLNTALGVGAGSGVTTASNVTCIGANASGADVSNTTWVANVYGVTTVSGTTLPVIVSQSGQLGTMASSRRFKREIKPMDQTSETILALKPVTFHYKSDDTGTPQFGLIAEEVADVNPDLVVRDKNGEIYSVRYEAVNAMLLNEFLKEHRKVEEQQVALNQLKSVVAQHRTEFKAAIAEQRKEMETRLKEQAAQIQKVSAQIEVRKPAPKVVMSKR